MSLLNLHKLPLTPEGPVKLLHLLLRHDTIVVTADQQHAYCPGDAFEMCHVVLCEERKGQTGLYLLLEEVQEKGDQWLRETSLTIDDSSYHLLQRLEGTIQDQLVDDLMIFGCEENGRDCSHTPPPNSQPLYLEVLIRLPEHCLRVC